MQITDKQFEDLVYIRREIDNRLGDIYDFLDEIDLSVFNKANLERQLDSINTGCSIMEVILNDINKNINKQ